jgi:hypothetical protein
MAISIRRFLTFESAKLEGEARLGHHIHAVVEHDDAAMADEAVAGRKCLVIEGPTSQKGTLIMTYRVSLESGDEESIEEVNCEDWAAVHAALDRWHSQVHFTGRYLMIYAFEKRRTPRIKIPGDTDQASV